MVETPVSNLVRDDGQHLASRVDAAKWALITPIRPQQTVMEHYCRTRAEAVHERGRPRLTCRREVIISPLNNQKCAAQPSVTRPFVLLAPHGEYDMIYTGWLKIKYLKVWKTE